MHQRGGSPPVGAACGERLAPDSRRLSSGVKVPIATGALISLTGVSANATAPLLLAESVGPTDPLLGYVVTAYSAAGALGGIGFALWARITPLTVVMRVAVTTGTLAAVSVPYVPPLAVPAVMLGVGIGLSGTLPLLVTLAKRPGETSAASAVARVLGLATGLRGLGYAGIGALQAAVGYGPALTLTALLAGGSGSCTCATPAANAMSGINDSAPHQRAA